MFPIRKQKPIITQQSHNPQAGDLPAADGDTASSTALLYHPPQNAAGGEVLVCYCPRNIVRAVPTGRWLARID